MIVSLGIARFAFTALLPPMTQTYLNITFAGILASANFAGYLAGAILSMFISNISLKVRLFRLGLVLAILSTVILGLTTNDTLWLVARIIGGFAGAMGFIVGSSIVMMKLRLDSKTKAMGIHFSGIGISIITTDLICRLVLKNNGTWQQSWLVLAFCGIFLAIYAGYILCFDKAQKTNHVHTKFDLSIFNLFTVILIIAYFTEGVGFVVQATFLPDIVNSLPGLDGYGNLIWIFAGLAGIPSCIIWMRLAHKYGSVNIIIIALSIQIVGILIPTLTSNIYLNLLSGIFYGGTFIGLVALFMNLGGHLSKGNPVILMGAITTAYGIGQVIAPLYSIYFVQKYGNYDIALYVTAFIVFIGVFLLVFAKKLPTEKI